jgi:hypothetical protein
MIFKIVSPKKFAKKLSFLTQNKAKSFKNLIITLVFKKKSQFFRRKLSKIADSSLVLISSRPASDQLFDEAGA